MSDEDGAPFFEDLDLGDACIPEIAKPNANNSVTWTTKVHLRPDSSESPLGQMSFWAKVLYVITPGKDKTAEQDVRNDQVRYSRFDRDDEDEDEDQDI